MSNCRSPSQTDLPRFAPIRYDSQTATSHLTHAAKEGCMHSIQPHPSLTAVVVANGSIEALQRSLATAVAVAKEVLIAPTALTPDRDQMQLSAGVRFVDSAELDHRGKVRNAALAQATGAWLLWLEA